mmetsp:Transcript_19363/g.29870  ORF Transcript_19363/g.29870 Transcript_19363/m.29870 type:complete len:144 (+) Transcript_19363:151-582(+)
MFWVLKAIQMVSKSPTSSSPDNLKRTLQLLQELVNMFGNLKEQVWFNWHSIANFLLLALLVKEHHIYFDSADQNEFWSSKAMDPSCSLWMQDKDLICKDIHHVAWAKLARKQMDIPSKTYELHTIYLENLFPGLKERLSIKSQ